MIVGGGGMSGDEAEIPSGERPTTADRGRADRKYCRRGSSSDRSRDPRLSSPGWRLYRDAITHGARSSHCARCRYSAVAAVHLTWDVCPLPLPELNPNPYINSLP